MNKQPIFWDGYGLGVANSGVFVHAKKIAHALSLEQINPCLVTTENWSNAMPEIDAAILKERLLFARFYQSKLIWPLRVRIALEKYLSEQGLTGILHGFANFNLSSWNKTTTRLRTVLTVHDLIPLLQPKLVSRALAYQFRLGFRRAIEAADRIVCVSDWTRNTLVERFPVALDKTLVIPNGIDKPRLIRPKIKHNKPIRVLCIARNEPYKNIGFLLKIAQIAGPLLDVNLVTNDSISSPFIRVHQRVNVEQLKRMQEEADVYVHPSLFEGFCLPAAEALIAGTPVVYMRGSGIDEVAGDQVGFPLSSGASPKLWIERIREARDFAVTPEFNCRLEQWLSKLPSWKDSALSIKTLYNGLYEKQESGN